MVVVLDEEHNVRILRTFSVKKCRKSGVLFSNNIRILRLASVKKYRKSAFLFNKHP